jgi:hypothetical protein
VVEFALIVPIALLLMGAALDLGRLFYAQVAIENAAREGAFFGSANPRCDTATRAFCADPDTAEWRVRNEAVGLDGLNVAFTCSSGGTPVSMTSCQAGDTYQAVVSTGFGLVTPLLLPIVGSNINLEASATAIVLDDAFDPNASPQPQASVPPLCTVPDMIGMEQDDAKDAWKDAGFETKNFESPGMHKKDIVGAQSIPANWVDPCDTATITVSE